MLGRGRQTRPEVAEVVEVRAGHHDPKLGLLGDASEHVVQLGLAVVAPVGAVRQVRRPLGFMRADRAVGDSQLRRDPAGVIGLAGGERRRHRRDRERAVPERSGGNRGDERGVRSPRVGDDHTSGRRKGPVKLFELA